VNSACRVQGFAALEIVERVTMSPIVAKAMSACGITMTQHGTVHPIVMMEYAQRGISAEKIFSVMAS